MNHSNIHKRLALTLLLGSAGVSFHTNAAVMTLNFSGELFKLGGTQNLLQGVKLGDTITGRFIIDTDATAKQSVDARVDNFDVLSVAGGRDGYSLHDVDSAIFTSGDANDTAIIQDVKATGSNDGSCTSQSYCRSISLASYPEGGAFHTLQLTSDYFQNQIVKAGVEALQLKGLTGALNEPTVWIRYGLQTGAANEMGFIDARVKLNYIGAPAPVPLPAAAWMFLTAIGGFAGLRFRKQTAS